MEGKDYVAHYASITKKYNLAAQVTSSYSYPQVGIVRQTREERQQKALAAAKNTVDESRF
jgi:transcriptional regulator of met regulon